jgi:hypothetical protein
MLAQDEIGAWPSSCAKVASSATISLDVAFDPKSLCDEHRRRWLRQPGLSLPRRK